jgi:hypothetical protein
VSHALLAIVGQPRDVATIPKAAIGNPSKRERMAECGNEKSTTDGWNWVSAVAERLSTALLTFVASDSRRFL